MKTIFISLTLIFALICGSSVKASQPNENHSNDLLPKFIFTVQPLYAIISGLRVDTEIILHRNHSLQLSPILFYSNNFSGSDISGVFFDRKRGAGLHFYHRFYPGKGLGKSSLYISHGPMWHFNNIKWQETIPGDKVERFNSIHRIGWDVMIGSYFISSDRFVLDIYTGMGIRHSILRTDAENLQEMNYNYWSPGYSGAILLLGFRVGLATGTKTF